MNQSIVKEPSGAVVVLAAVVCLYFLIAMIAWVVCISNQTSWLYSVDAGICLLLLVCSVSVLVLAIRRKVRSATVGLGLLLIVSLTLCWYDISHHRYQSITVHVGSDALLTNEYYCTWWWYHYFWTLAI